MWKLSLILKKSRLVLLAATLCQRTVCAVEVQRKGQRRAPEGDAPETSPHQVRTRVRRPLLSLAAARRSGGGSSLATDADFAAGEEESSSESGGSTSRAAAFLARGRAPSLRAEEDVKPSFIEDEASGGSPAFRNKRLSKLDQGGESGTSGGAQVAEHSSSRSNTYAGRRTAVDASFLLSTAQKVSAAASQPAPVAPVAGTAAVPAAGDVPRAAGTAPAATKPVFPGAVSGGGAPAAAPAEPAAPDAVAGGAPPGGPAAVPTVVHQLPAGTGAAARAQEMQADGHDDHEHRSWCARCALVIVCVVGVLIAALVALTLCYVNSSGEKSAGIQGETTSRLSGPTSGIAPQSRLNKSSTASRATYGPAPDLEKLWEDIKSRTSTTSSRAPSVSDRSQPTIPTPQQSAQINADNPANDMENLTKKRPNSSAKNKTNANYPDLSAQRSRGRSGRRGPARRGPQRPRSLQVSQPASSMAAYLGEEGRGKMPSGAFLPSGVGPPSRGGGPPSRGGGPPSQGGGPPSMIAQPNPAMRSRSQQDHYDSGQARSRRKH